MRGFYNEERRGGEFSLGEQYSEAIYSVRSIDLQYA